MSFAPGASTHLKVFAAFVLLGTLFFFPILDNTFLSDDYHSLYRIAVEKRILYRGIFRPLIDISFYLNYFFSGLEPLGFYVTNLLIHVTTSFMVYRVAFDFKIVPEENRFLFALISGFFFLIYPFHVEGVAWLTGRLASIACLAALVIIYWSKRSANSAGWFTASALVFLAALCGYESIVLLPILVFFWNFDQVNLRKRILVLAAWGFVIAIYLGLRVYFSGSLTSSGYGIQIAGSLSKLAYRAVKVFSRLFLPPMENSALLLKIASAFAVFLALLSFIVWKKFRHDRKLLLRYTVLVTAMLTSLLLPMAFGISTRTSEGDRLLYFPSVFVCLGISAMIFVLRSRVNRWLVASVIGFYFLYFLTDNIGRWDKASVLTRSILDKTSMQFEKKQVLVNVPEEIEGAYVFRVGLSEALKLHRVNYGNITVLDTLDRLDYFPLADTIRPLFSKNSIFLPPYTRFSFSGNKWLVVCTKNNQQALVDINTSVGFWDKHQWKQLTLPGNER